MNGKKLLVVLGLVLIGWPAAAQDKRALRTPGPSVGDPAPDFKLKTLEDSGKDVQLSSFKEKKPVVLLFGSYT